MNLAANLAIVAGLAGFSPWAGAFAAIWLAAVAYLDHEVRHAWGEADRMPGDPGVSVKRGDLVLVRSGPLAGLFGTVVRLNGPLAHVSACIEGPSGPHPLFDWVYHGNLTPAPAPGTAAGPTKG